MRWILWVAMALAAWGQADWREALVDGRRIRYQVVEGQAIWQGDIILGPAESIGKAGRGSAVRIGQGYRWPDNTIPYVIADDVPDKSRVENAVQHWNTKTPMRLTPRRSEGNYVEFRRAASGACSSSVGMVGGRQFVLVPDDCPTGSVIHEIGHVVGLYHTQSRDDRDLYVRMRPEGIDRANLSQFDQDPTAMEDVGPYPYDSIMHYSPLGYALPGAVAMETMPVGIPLGQRASLAASDIDTVVRLAGGRPTKTVVTSNPEGIPVVVDGQTVVTPAEFDWAEGSRHTVSVDDYAAPDGDLWFARWSDFGERSHTYVASLSRTVLTANMRRMWKLGLTALPGGAGVIQQTPEADNGFVAENSMVELTAVPASGYAFGGWSGFGFFSIHGMANPIRFPMASSQLSYAASFTRSALTTVTTNPPGLRITVDGTAFTSPRRFTWTAGSTHDVNVDTTSQSTLLGAAAHTWARWSDGGAQRHTVTAKAEGDTITAEFDTRYQVLASVWPPAAGRITMSPAPVNGFLPAGTTVTINAVPATGYGFTSWGGTVAGWQQQQTFVLNGDAVLRAEFALPNTLTAEGLVDGASFRSGAIAPGEIVNFFGLDLGPQDLVGLTLTAQNRVATSAGDVRVLFDGTEAPVIYASSRQVAAIVPYNVSGKSTVRVQLRHGAQLTNLMVAPVVQAAPAFFTANSSGRGGGAFLNADGTLNTEANPAARGSIVVLYATGFGVMQPAMSDGELAGPPYAKPAAPYVVRIGGRECEVVYGGAAPGLVSGLVQLNVRVPADVMPGVLPVTVEVAGIQSQRAVGVAVR